jgi:hypothetical protein
LSSLKDNAFGIMVIMYILGFATLGVQWEFADPYGHIIKNGSGAEMKSALKAYVDEDRVNQYTATITAGDFQGNSTYYDRVETVATAGAFVVWELITLMTGTYVFNILIWAGVPHIFVAILVITYVLLLARAIIGYLKPGN